MTDKIDLQNNDFEQFKNTVINPNCIANEINTIQIINNNFKSCTNGSVIDVENAINMSPIIKRNTFENITSNLPIFCFILNADIGSINLDNNTFRGFKMSNEFGGVGLNISNVNNDVTIEVAFNDCYFINNSNSEGKNQGGAISFSQFLNLGNLKLSVTNCFFENNHKENKGSSIYANIQHEIIIEYSIFKGDSCSAEGCIFIQPDYEEYKHESSILISKCNFEQSKTNFFSIYISAGSSKTLNIHTCSFNSDKGGIYIENFNNKIDILGNYFINTTEKSALSIQQSSKSIYNNEITINQCIFDSCKGIDNKCFDISTYTYKLFFQNNIIQNTKGTECNSYFGTINCNNKIVTFEVRNISFISNLCDSLYGGGTGIKFTGINQLAFVDSCFIGNGAVQNYDVGRPIQVSKKPYYNGDGDGIQLGYICSTNNYNVLFQQCTFNKNHAQRHCGAIAIQTTGTVEIISCIFENNEAYYNFNSGSELLIENHFDKKYEGRGGAIYINPSYTYEDNSNECQSPTSFLSQIKIEKSIFIKNNGYDGYGVYIEGDDPGTTFLIQNNTFSNNYNSNNQ